MQVTRILELSKVRLLLINSGVFHRTHIWDAVTLQAETGIQGRHAIGILLFFFSGLCSHCVSSSSSCVLSTSFSQWIIQRKTNSILPTQILLKWPYFSSLDMVLQFAPKQGRIGWTLASRSSFSVDQIPYQRTRRMVVTRKGEIFWAAEAVNGLVVITQMKTSIDYFWNSFPHKYWCSVLSLLIFSYLFCHILNS